MTPEPSGLTAEDLVSVVDVLAELLPEFAGARIVRPWALAAAGAAADGSIAGVDVHHPGAIHGTPGPRGTLSTHGTGGEDGAESRARAMAETIRRLKPLDRGNDAFAVTAVLVDGLAAGTRMSFDRASAIAGVRHPGF